MNQKQAVVLALGIILAVALVMLPNTHTPLRHVITRTLPNGTIVGTYQSHEIVWKPAAYLLVVLVTGYAVYRLRTAKE